MKVIVAVEGPAGSGKSLVLEAIIGVLERVGYTVSKTKYEFGKDGVPREYIEVAK